MPMTLSRFQVSWVGFVNFRMSTSDAVLKRLKYFFFGFLRSENVLNSGIFHKEVLHFMWDL